MSKKIFCTTSNHSIGSTFLDWSVHYLNNQDNFFNTDLGWIKLTDDPVSKINAHGHLKNHPSGFKETEKTIQSFSKETNGLFSVYPTQLDFNKCAKELNIPISEIGEDKNFSNILNYNYKDFSNIWDMCHKNNIQMIYIKLTSDPLYLLSHRAMPKKMLSDGSHESIDTILEEYIEVFFKDDARQFFKNNLCSAWELREFLSLNIRPFKTSNVDDNVDFSKPHFYLNANDWWLDGDRAIIDIMKYLNLPINNDRLSRWHDIYHRWQQIQLRILRFQWNFDHICNSIINNKFYSIKEYNLSLLQEAAIQHVMLYKYGYNFKAYGLEKFPNNTQDLHSLLEPNVNHEIEDIYGCLK